MSLHRGMQTEVQLDALGIFQSGLKSALRLRSNSSAHLLRLSSIGPGLVGLWLLPWLAVGACGAEPLKPSAALPGRAVAPGVRLIGRIENPRITESSGVAASRHYPDIFWTHNDGGGGRKQVLCAMSREGNPKAEFIVGGLLLRDWEDIAIDDQRHLFIGDIGNNDAKRHQLAVHQIDEPDPKSGGFVFVQRSWQLRYPNQPFDCESLFVWQTHGYLVSKVLKDERAEIYRFPLADPKEPFTLEWVARLRIDSPVTGADISADGRLLGLVAKSGAFAFRIDGDVARAARLKPFRSRFRHEHIEGCCFVPEGLLATAESREVYLFVDEFFRPEK